jgi:acetyl esterase/lipase
MTMIDYPLAPENNYKETLQMVKHSYLLLTEKYINDSFIFMGDSAGGNIVLSFIQQLIEENISNLPIRNILFSPCVDLTFSNPEIKEVEHLDLILSRDLVQFGAAQYANGDDLNHYLLSPINGDLNNLPETVIFYGTHEILMPDILRFKAKAERLGARIYFHEYEGMQHDWVLFSMPERERVIQEVVGLIGT